jgi:hypothetical protein
MVAHLTKFVRVTPIGYPIIARNGEILAIIIDNGFSYNKVFTKPIEALKGNHSNGLKKYLLVFMLESL